MITWRTGWGTRPSGPEISTLPLNILSSGTYAFAIPREGIPQCKLMANRNEMVATWRKKYRRAKIQDEKFVMKKAIKKAGNFASYQKKKKKERQILHASLISLDKIALPRRGKWLVRIKTNKTCIENLVYKYLVIAVGCKEETKCGNRNRRKRWKHNNRNQSCND